MPVFRVADNKNRGWPAENYNFNRSGTMVLPFLGLYLTTKLGFSMLSAGHVLSVYGLGALAGAWLGGFLADRVDPVLVQVAPWPPSSRAMASSSRVPSISWCKRQKVD